MLKTILIIAGVVIFVARFILPRLKSVMIPPARIRLVPAAAGGSHARDVAARRPELEAAGFRVLGTYRVEPMRGVVLTAFAHPEQSLCAVVYGHPVVKCFVDMFSKTEDDRSLTVTTAPAGQELDQPPGHEKIFERNLTIPRMVELILRRRPQGRHEPWDAGNFASKFEAAYAKEMDWRRNRGGVTLDEVRRVAQASGSKATEKQVVEATRRLQEQYTSAPRGDTR
jgi:hypothetical protein